MSRERCVTPAERDCFAWAEFWNGGLAYYGGLDRRAPRGLCVSCSASASRSGRPPTWSVRCADRPLLRAHGLLPRWLLLRHAPTRSAVSFPAGSAASEGQVRERPARHKALPSLPVHPTQLYEAVGCLAIAALLSLCCTPRKRFDGQVCCVPRASTRALRFGLEFLRADDRGALLGLSTSQLIGLVVVAVACAAVCVAGPAANAASACFACEHHTDSHRARARPNTA